MPYQWDFATLLQYRGLILVGVLTTIGFTLLTAVLGLVVGVVVALGRMTGRRWISAPLVALVEVFRCTPVLVQLIWCYYALPVLIGVEMSPGTAAALTLSLYGGSFYAEIIRGGIASIEVGQWDAGRALGLTRLKLMRLVIMPQALKRMIPPLVNQTILQLKNTALVSVLAVPDLLYQGQLITSATYRPLETYSVIAILYFMLLFPLTRMAQALNGGWRGASVRPQRPIMTPSPVRAYGRGDRMGWVMRLEGKVAIVTGAASGIGQATAALFLREGAAVLGVDQTAEGIPAGCQISLADVTDEEAANAAVAGLGRVDVLVTAAGISVGKSAGDTSLTDFQRVMAVNVTGTFLWVRACLPLMIAQGRGSIVTIASQLARAGGRGNAAYVASKGAVAAFTRAVAVDYATDGVRCNAVLPGAIDTPMLARSMARAADPEAARARSRNRHPMQRFGRAEEVAQSILHLASDESSFVTGIELPVDGGWLAG